MQKCSINKRIKNEGKNLLTSKKKWSVKRCCYQLVLHDGMLIYNCIYDHTEDLNSIKCSWQYFVCDMFPTLSICRLPKWYRGDNRRIMLYVTCFEYIIWLYNVSHIVLFGFMSLCRISENLLPISAMRWVPDLCYC